MICTIKNIKRKIKTIIFIFRSEITLAIILEPNNYEIYYLKGKILIDQEKYDEALKIFNRVLQLNKDHSSTYFRKGICYEKMGKYKEALEEYQNCQKYVPKDEQLSNCIAICLFELKKNDEALEQFNKTLKINSQNKLANEYKQKLTKRRRMSFRK